MKQSPHPHDIESDPVWNLLEQTSRPTTSAQFGQNVMRPLLEQEAQRPWWKKMPSFWLLPSFGVATALIVAGFFFFSPETVIEDPITEVTIEAVDQIENDLLMTDVADIDDLSDDDVYQLVSEKSVSL